MIDLEVDATFEAAHHLPHVPHTHKCGRVHGHSYALTVVFGGEPDPVFGWVADFAELRDIVAVDVGELDHQDLNEILANPTSEFLAMWLFERLSGRVLRRNVRDVAAPPLIVREVRLSETGRSRVVYRGE